MEESDEIMKIPEENVKEDSSVHVITDKNKISDCLDLNDIISNNIGEDEKNISNSNERVTKSMDIVVKISKADEEHIITKTPAEEEVPFNHHEAIEQIFKSMKARHNFNSDDDTSDTSDDETEAISKTLEKDEEKIPIFVEEKKDVGVNTEIGKQDFPGKIDEIIKCLKTEIEIMKRIKNEDETSNGAEKMKEEISNSPEVKPELLPCTQVQEEDTKSVEAKMNEIPKTPEEKAVGSPLKCPEVMDEEISSDTNEKKEENLPSPDAKDETLKSKEVIVVDGEEDDDLMIIDEIPPPPNKKSSLDLDMDCEDEPLEISQQSKEQTESAAFRETLKLVKKWSLKKKIGVKRSGSTVLGSKGRDIGISGTPLIRPQQPQIGKTTGGATKTSINIPPNYISARPINANGTPVSRLTVPGNRPPYSILRQTKGTSPRTQIIVRPSTRASIPVQYRAVGKTTRPAPPVTVVTTTQLPTTSPQNQFTSGTTPNQLTLPNGQVLNMQHFQPLLFDSNSGLLLMPSSATGGQGNGLLQAVPQILPNANQIRSLVGSTTAGSTRMISRTSVSTTPQQPYKIRMGGRLPTISTSIAPPNNPFSPRIVGTTSMSNMFSRAIARPVSIANQVPPALQKPASSFVPRRPPPLSRAPGTASTNKPRQQVARPPALINRPPATVVRTPPPLAPTRPAAPPVPQVETTNQFNVAQNDKDPNNNKTYPSLVVVVKPCLGDKVNRQALNAARAELDARVKALLLHSAAKLTEWLMQQGLLRLEHRCHLHMTADREYIKYKLGMYSDGAKQPFSGGYVWITECCPDKQISVFHGSIFESAVYTPGTIVKLIYHWACQTTAANVLQWVKVSSYYLKNFYTLLRSSCVAALHEYAPVMGGPQKFVEVGIITLGAAQPNKSLKIEILGVFDPASKVIRMKVINPLGNPTPVSSQTRVQQILYPLKHWVDRDSTLLIDTSIEKSYLLEMGFKTVIQSKSGGAVPSTGAQPTNSNVMNYLKHVVPKMFQSTLCVLSKSLLQQFLDELSWREIWGSTSAAAFDNIITHVVQMTKWDLGETLISRLNKISLNPFAEWSYTKPTATGIDLLPDSIRGVGTDMPTLEAYAAYAEAANGYTNTGPTSPQLNKSRKNKFTGATPGGPPVLRAEEPQRQPLKRKAENQDTHALLRAYLFEHEREAGKMVNLFTYYYAEAKDVLDKSPSGTFPSTLKCPLCGKGFLTNYEIVRHLSSHVNSLARPSQQAVFCEYCLKELHNPVALASHVAEVHRLEDALYACYICQEHFPNKTALTLHMWETHGKAEMPYRCDCCNYRNSKHDELVEHFTKAHAGCDQVLCPVCLKVVSAKTVADMKHIVVHLQSHSQKKGKKCGQCCLLFASDLDYRGHIATGAHDEVPNNVNYSSLRSVERKQILMPIPPKHIARSKFYGPPQSKKPRTYQNLSKGPKQKQKDPHLEKLDKEGTLRIESIKFFGCKEEENNDSYKCCECKQDVLSPHHFTGCFKCSKCKFSTSCEMSMLTHNRNAHPLGQPMKSIASIPTSPLSRTGSQAKCKCGYSSESLKILMKHMMKCGKRTGTIIKSIENGDDDDMPQLVAEDFTI